MAKFPLVRLLYLYLFSLVGLLLMIVAGVKFIDMGLRIFVFKQIEREERIMQQQPPFAPSKVLEIDKAGKVTGIKEEVSLTPEEKIQLEQWLAEYQRWQEERGKIDPITTARQREVSNNLAMILVGLPLYLYHWRIIQKENKEETKPI
jgi:hypothetical protein